MKSMGGAAWFNGPVYFEVGSSPTAAVGAIIVYNPCVAYYHHDSPSLGFLNGQNILYASNTGSGTTTDPGSYLEVSTNTSYKVEVEITSSTSALVNVYSGTTVIANDRVTTASMDLSSL